MYEWSRWDLGPDSRSPSNVGIRSKKSKTISPPEIATVEPFLQHRSGHVTEKRPTTVAKRVVLRSAKVFRILLNLAEGRRNFVHVRFIS